MTWGEFKAALQRAGVEDTDIISWIDVDNPANQEALEISRGILRGAKTLVGLEVSNYD